MKVLVDSTSCQKYVKTVGEFKQPVHHFVL